MKFFEKKEKISRKEFKDIIKKKNPILPGAGRQLFSFDERKKMEEKLFGRKEITSLISRKEYENLIIKIKKEKYRARDWSQKQIVDKKVKFLRKLGGI